MLEHSCDAKVSDFDRPILIHENILRLQITVQNFPIMNMLDSKRHLHKPIEYLVLAVLDFAEFLLVCYFCVEVSAIGIVHDDAQTPLVHKRLLVSDNIWVTHGLEHMNFVDRVLSLLPIHLRNVDDLHDVLLAVLHRLHENCKAK